MENIRYISLLFFYWSFIKEDISELKKHLQYMHKNGKCATKWCNGSLENFTEMIGKYAECCLKLQKCAVYGIAMVQFFVYFLRILVVLLRPTSSAIFLDLPLNIGFDMVFDFLDDCCHTH